jgi:hypothetical protein
MSNRKDEPVNISSQLLRSSARSVKTWILYPKSNERRRWSKFAYPHLNVAMLDIIEETKLEPRPNYTWGVLHAAHLARAVGINSISVIEFGVAGGEGLIYLEDTADKVEKRMGVGIDVYGFDTGKGLPKPVDYRDLPDLYEPGTYPMDQEALKKRLRRAKLILGMIKDTLAGFIASKPAPVGFVSIDLDLYSSTMDAFKLFEADHTILLPRIHCYMDDIMGFTFSEFTGERRAVNDFNALHEMKKISPIFGMKYFVPVRFRDSSWAESFFLAHFFDHPLYAHDGGLVSEKHENLGT